MTLVFEVDMSAGGKITRGYFNGVTTNEVLAVDQVFNTNQIDTVWLFPDHAGTVRTVGRYDSGENWDVFHRNIDQVGNISFNFAGKDENKLGDTGVEVLDEAPIYFAGHQGHKLLMLYDTGDRWYDPRSQRYLIEDLRGYATGAENLYVYGGGDPVNVYLGERRPEFSFSAGAHGLLGLGGLVPGAGVVFDSLDAGLYYAEGNLTDAAFSAAAAVPGLGYAANAARGANTASRLYRASHVFDVGANLAESSYYGLQGYASGNSLQLGLSAFGFVVNARAATGIISDGARAFNRNFEIRFDTSGVYTQSLFGGIRPPFNIHRRAPLAPDEIRFLDLQRDTANRSASQVSGLGTSGETISTSVGKEIHKTFADSRRASGNFDLVHVPIRNVDGSIILVPRRIDLKTGRTIIEAGLQEAIPDAVNFERRLIIDDKPLGRPLAKDRQEIIRFIEAFRQREGHLPTTIGIQRYDSRTGQPIQTDLHTPQDFLPGR